MTQRRFWLFACALDALWLMDARAAGPPPGRRRLGVPLFDNERITIPQSILLRADRMIE